MNAVQLWETTMNPETRSLIEVTIDDAMAADEISKYISLLNNIANTEESKFLKISQNFVDLYYKFLLNTLLRVCVEPIDFLYRYESLLFLQYSLQKV